MKKTSLVKTIIIKAGMITAVLFIIGIVYTSYKLTEGKELARVKEAKHFKEMITIDVNTKLDPAVSIALSIANNSNIVKALKTNDRELALNVLQNIIKSFKNNTNYKHLKIHIHTKDIHSFLRAWKPKKHGDDLSGFRATIVHVANTHKALRAIEVGRAGIVIRGLAPIFDEDRNYIGSIECILGYNSIVKKYAKKGKKLAILMDSKFKRGNALTQDKYIGNYILSQKVYDESFINALKSVNLNQLKTKPYLVANNFFITAVPIKDFKGNLIGLYVVGDEISDVDKIANDANNITIQTVAYYLIVIIVILAIIGIIANKHILSSVKEFENKFREFLDFISYKTNKFEPAEIKVMDEFGVMLNDLNEIAKQYDKALKEDMKVMGELVIIADKMKQGIFRCRIKSNTNNPMILTLKKTINNLADSTENYFSKMREVLESYTSDDYTPKIDIEPVIKEDLRAVMEDINELGEALRNTAKANLQNGQTLESNASSMNDSMQNLAAKANQQAASLEETAAAVEEITSITRNNANNSATMAKLGNEVKVAVEDGNKLAHQTVTAMDSINERVTAINEAISVIDQIAFQTNILSLNAAVEAATAGEAGKGFAVVAGEVRNLAARSAEAANEIKKLVEEATLKANEGKEISEDMIAGYERLNEQITQTINIIEQVSTASKEQMQGIEQINDAVNTLDRVTQENASEANHVAQIANELKQLANNLLEDAKSKRF